MPSLTSFICCALLFLILALAWIFGLSLVKRLAPQHLVAFCVLFTSVRLTVVLAVIGTYVFCLSDSLAESKAFAVMALIMYGLMMVITYVIKH
jgi:hypothetical protein